MPASRTDEERGDPDTDPNPGARTGSIPGARSELDSPSDPDGDPVLTAERAHLRSSREFLRLMRENVLSLKALGGDPVSEQYLKADLSRRAEALRDMPDTPLFFGRLDYAVPAIERFHVGRRHVHDRQGHPMVIDWRAPISRPFYRASPAEPMGLSRRRRFGFAAGELTAYEDEDFTTGAAGGSTIGQGTEQRGAASRILVEEIERPRVGPMRDIVATIQPDQDDIVRAEADETVCVQGAPGTGKTAVGLHRVAYLLYAHRERMHRRGVLVVGPNRAFLGYIRSVLPALGELDVAQVTVAELVATVPIRRVDTGNAGRLKGDERMAEVLRRGLWARLREPAGELMLSRGSRRWRVPAYEIAELVDELRERGVRYGAGREMLSHRIAHVILSRMEAAGESCDDRTHEAVRRTKPVRAAVDSVWPAVDPARLVMLLLSDAEELARAADGLLDRAEQSVILFGTAPRGPGSARWSAADAVLIDEATDLIARTPSLGHVVVDEAQDLSAMECRAIGRRCATGAATVLGDIAQGTTAWASESWESLLRNLGKPDAALHVLDRGYRVPRQIIDYASRLLPHIAPDLAPAVSVRQSPGSLQVLHVKPDELLGRLTASCHDALAMPGSIGLIAADDQIPAIARALDHGGLRYTDVGAANPDPDQGEPVARLVLIPVTLAKGLEFDQVIVVEPAHIVGAEPRGLRRLYVALTRAVSRLYVLHSQSLPGPLQ